MTDDLIAIDDISDELPPAFMILDDESRQNITAIFSFDKTKILAIPKIILKAGNGSNEFFGQPKAWHFLFLQA